jgi:predicted  nucleic acid-binding Zn ribbon protein
MHDVHVACPCCKNRRLFDADLEAVEGVIKIKCQRCRSVIAVSFHNKKVRTEQIGA